MIDPQERARRIILNEPALAEPLLDLLIWIAELPNIKEDSDYDDILDLLWLKLQNSRDARDAYARMRLEHVDREEGQRSVDAIAASGNH